MKTNHLISLVLKFFGLLLLWRAIQTLPVLFGSFGMLGAIFKGNFQMITVLFILLFNLTLPLVMGIVLFLNTSIVVNLFKIDETDSIKFNLGSLKVFYFAVLLFAMLLILQGTSKAVSYNYETKTNTEFVSHQAAPLVSTTKSTNKTVNYFSFIELAIGILLLYKGKPIALYFHQKVVLSEE